jgi:hypothetical protein
MSHRWLVAGSLLFASILAARAQDADTLYAPGIPSRSQEVPILTSTDSPPAADAFLHPTTTNTYTTQRAPDATGQLADSANENLDVGWHLPVFSLFSVGYDTAVNAFRQDQAIWDDEEATSQITSALINKGSLEVNAGDKLKWTGYAQLQRAITDGQPGYSDATKYGTEAAWTPVKDVTTVKLDASTQETVNFDHSILEEKLYTASLDQKLPWMPFTLHTAGSVTDDQSPLLAASDKDNTIMDASLLWKIVPSTSLSGGYQRQDANTPATFTLQNTNTYFTQVSLQPAKAWTVTMRAAHEQTTATQAAQFLSNSSDVLLSFGLTWTLGDRFNAGAGLNYRVLQSQTPAPAINTPPATFSISAGGKF